MKSNYVTSNSLKSSVVALGLGFTALTACVEPFSFDPNANAAPSVEASTVCALCLPLVGLPLALSAMEPG